MRQEEADPQKGMLAMPGTKIITEHTDDLGNPVAPGTRGSHTTHEGIGATVGVDIHEGIGANLSAATAEGIGSGGAAQGSSFGTAGGRAEVGPTANNGVPQDAVRGNLEFIDPYLKKWGPIYNIAVQRHYAKANPILLKSGEQIVVIDGLIRKFQEKTGWLAAAGDFLSDPLALLSLAGAVATSGASAAGAAQRALSSWSKEQGAEAAVKKLQAAREKAMAEGKSQASAMGVYRPFTADGLSVDLNQGRVPRGTTWHQSARGPHVIGTAPLPRDFESWAKHKHKMYNQVGVRPLRFT